jgi:Tol biopolymer transport system component
MLGGGRILWDGPSRPSLCRSGLARAALCGSALLLALGATRVEAQLFERPWLNWRTVHAGRFDVHYPSQLTDWAQFVAARLPAVDTAVTRLVGYSPPQRVQIVIEDPFDVSNGFAFTLLDHPLIVFWASPPDPRESIGQFRTWGEMLAVHEFGHVAHLTRPSRNRLARTLWRVAPLAVGPIAYRSPRWVIEGYATYIEGVVTGTGRPHGVWRPATLRQWAIEGHLPNYAQLSNWSDFEGGDFAYLAGSAFLEWLARRNGDSSLVTVWRRLTARANRSFDEAFAGVYGDPPAVLYDRFRAEVTADAVGIDSTLVHAGLVEGEMVQHLTRGTGDPTISKDGKFAALVLRALARPPRVVVWNTTPEPDTLDQRLRERVLARDPQDVPARRIYPVPKRAHATLVARDGRAYEDPRWLPDGKRLLLWRSTRRPDGSLQPELYLWDLARHDVTRLTKNAGVRDADPSPDGRHAVALRCPGGHCDVVTVDLGTGAVRVLAAGDVLTTFARPRWSPDGRTIAVALQRDNRWRIALIDVEGSAPRFVDPEDGANRFEPAWLGPRSVVAVSDRGGAPNLERIDFGSSAAPVARSLTRVTGAAVAPEPNASDGSIWFLSLYSRGYDVRRLAAPTPLADPTPSPLLDSRLVPAVVTPTTFVRAFSPAPTSTPEGYRWGPRTTRWFPAASIGTTGREATLALLNTDAVGRLSLLGQLALGSGDAWRGGSLEGVWRGTRPELHLTGFIERSDSRALQLSSTLPLTSDLRGGYASIEYARAFDTWSARVSAGGSPEWLTQRSPGLIEFGAARYLGFAELRALSRQTSDELQATESLAAHGTLGRTGGESFDRELLTATLHVASGGAIPLDLSGAYGRVSTDAPQFERFSIGGLASTLTPSAILSQRIVMPALPAVVATGDQVLTGRVATTLLGLTPFLWSASSRDGPGRFEVWHRVYGVDFEVTQSPVSVLGTPGARLLIGMARSLDAPFANQTRGYGVISFRP